MSQPKIDKSWSLTHVCLGLGISAISFEIGLERIGLQTSYICYFIPQVTESKTKKLGRKGSTSSTSSSSSSSMLDPLSSVLDGTDPLSLFAATADPLLTMTTVMSFQTS